MQKIRIAFATDNGNTLIDRYSLYESVLSNLLNIYNHIK